jgi:DNA-binding NtrC family response regulator
VNIKKQPNEKVLRLRYIRILEKFVSRIVALLKQSSFDKELFKASVEKYYLEIKNTKSVRLNSQYHNKLQDYINLTLQQTQTNLENTQQLLLKEANLLHKEKNKTNYKKDKHKKKDFYGNH